MNPFDEIMRSANKSVDQMLYEETLRKYSEYSQTHFDRIILFEEAIQKDLYSQIIMKCKRKSFVYETDKPVNYWFDMNKKTVHIVGTVINIEATELLVVLSAKIIPIDGKENGKNKLSEKLLRKYETIMSGVDEPHKKVLYQKINEIADKKYHLITDEYEKEVFFSTEAEINALYEVMKPILPKNIREEIERCFTDSKRTTNNSSAERTNARKVIYYLLNHDWLGKSREIDVKKTMEELNKKVIGQAKAKEIIEAELTSYNFSTDKHPNILLFVGSEGCGKTHLAETLFTVLGKKYSYYNVAGLNDPIVILGSSRTYENGRPSEITELYFENACDDGFIFDEIDKATPICINALLNIFSRRLRDDFIKVPVDIGKLWIIATANDIKNVHPALLRRVTIVNFVEYSYNEKAAIINNIFVPKMCTKYGISQIDAEFSPAVCQKIIYDYSGGEPITSTEQIINTIFVHALELGQKFPCITEDNFEEYYSFGSDTDIVKYTFAKDYSAIKRKVMICSKHYPEHIKKRNSELLQMALRGDDNEKEYALKSLRITANILNEELSLPEINSVIKELNVNHYGLDKPKKAIERELVRRILAPDSKGKFILLNGCAGVGKTSLGKSVAKALGRKFLKISLNGISSAETIKGFSRTYKDSEPGIIAKSLAKEEICTYAPVILADELDKMITDSCHDPYTAIYDLIDNQGGFYDHYLDTFINTDKLFIIFTSNDKSRIPSPILDRLEVIDCEGYSAKEKYAILKKYVLPNTAKQYNLKKINMSEKVINVLLTDYCISYGIRDCERAMENLVESKMLLRHMKSVDNITITEKDLYTILGAKSIGYNDFPIASKNMYGMARALAVTGNYGTTFGIQIVTNEYGKEDIEVTGLAKGSFAESILVAKTLVQNILHKPFPKVHIHVLDSGIEKDGPSAGITLFACMMSFMLKEPLPNCAFTGTIDLFGNIGLIGGTKLKLAAAEKAGVDTVYIPSENYDHLLLNRELAIFENLTIKPVCHVNEIVNELFRDSVSKIN